MAKTRAKRTKRTSGDTSTAAYRHTGETRANIPPAKIAAEGTVPRVPRVRYHFSPHLAPQLRFDSTGHTDRLAALIDAAGHRLLAQGEQAVLSDAMRHHQPWLEWAGKRERHDKGFFQVDPVALHIHERVSTQAILKAVEREDIQRSLFADPEQPYAQAVQFYRHRVEWSNRLILGDSLHVMASLARREQLAGQVQMIYFDPPYGIRFSSNFQPSLSQRDVKDREQDLTRETESVTAYRDAWTLGVHSYLAYLRDRLMVAKELLKDTGSIFVQIGDENLHLVRCVLDDVFGRDNSVVVITAKKKSSTGPTQSVADYILWYAKDAAKANIRRLSQALGEPEGDDKFRRVELDSGERRPATLLTHDERRRLAARFVRDDYPVVSQDPSETRSSPITVQGRLVSPGPNKHWRHDPEMGMPRLERCGRLRAGDTTAFGVEYWGDSGTTALSNLWVDLHGEADPIYVVQTNRRIVERCMAMTTYPGDLVLDPTCGSGTTAFVAEQGGRRWITCDTSRIALSLARCGCQRGCSC